MIPPNEKTKIKESIIGKLAEKYKNGLPEDFHELIQKRVEFDVTEYLRSQMVSDKTLTLLEKKIKKFQTELKIRARDRQTDNKGEHNIKSQGSLPGFAKLTSGGLSRTKSSGNMRQPTPKSLTTTNSKRSFYQAGCLKIFTN
jgi:hypothetical protein